MYIPEFMEDIKEKYKTAVANAFILTGNIGDYCTENLDLKKFLCEYITKDGQDDMRMTKVYFYDVESLGRRVFPTQADTKDETKICWSSFMEKIKEPIPADERRAFVFLYPEFLIPESNKVYEEEQKRIVSLHSTLSSYEFINSNNTVFIITESVKDINEKFTGSNSKTAVIELPLPGEDARREFIRYYLDTQMKRNPAFRSSIEKWPLDVEQLTNLTAGLQLVAIEDILLSAFTKERKKAEGKLPQDTVSIDHTTVMQRKSEVITKEYGDVIEIFDTAGYKLDDFAGQENLKQYFIDTIIASFFDPEIASSAPKGLLMMGPPGTGKSYFARCVAGQSRINFVEFKMSRILGKYVGESEKAMERVLSVCRALAPVGVFIDEIDQAFASRADGVSGSSVNNNLFGMLLAEMSKPENRGKILWLAATNYPNRVDEALKRAGRFDKKIPFFAPNALERKQMLMYHLKKHGFQMEEDAEGIVSIVAETDGYTPAEIEAVVVKAEELMRRRKNQADPMEMLLLAKSYMISAQNANIKQMEDLALVECSDAEFIPDEKKEHHKKLMHLVPEKNEISGTINRGYSER